MLIRVAAELGYLKVLEKLSFFDLSAQSKPRETLGRRATGLLNHRFNVSRAARDIQSLAAFLLTKKI